MEITNRTLWDLGASLLPLPIPVWRPCVKLSCAAAFHTLSPVHAGLGHKNNSFYTCFQEVYSNTPHVGIFPTPMELWEAVQGQVLMAFCRRLYQHVLCFGALTHWPSDDKTMVSTFYIWSAQCRVACGTPVSTQFLGQHLCRLKERCCCELDCNPPFQCLCWNPIGQSDAIWRLVIKVKWGHMSRALIRWLMSFPEEGQTPGSVQTEGRHARTQQKDCRLQAREGSLSSNPPALPSDTLILDWQPPELGGQGF